MRWSKGLATWRRAGHLPEGRRDGGATKFPWSALVIVIAASALLLSGSPDEKRITIYSAVANYSLPAVERNKQDYVGLLEVLDPLGNVSTKANGSRWILRYNDVESEFTAGATKASVRGSDFVLPARFLLENGRGLVPLSGLDKLLGRILGGPVTMSLSARRVFVGNVAIHFTAQVDKTAPPKLVMNFTAPVNPTIATEPGKLRMVFNHEAVVAPGSSTLTFDSKVIPSASFQENNGAAEIIVNTTIPLMARFGNDGRTITLASPVQAQAAAPATAQEPTATQNQPGTAPNPAPTLVASTSSPVRYFVVIDAAHGGEERGAALTDQLVEKDVTLAFARRLNQELNGRGLSSTMLRNGDTTLTTDQRASAANAVGAAIYIAIHAATQGNGIRLYSALLPVGGENHGPFLDWDTAQRTVVWTSQMAEKSVATELRNRQLSARILTAPLRPLNNITSAAIAIEVSVPTSSVDQLSLPSYQQLIATAVTDGLVDVREQLEAGRR